MKIVADFETTTKVNDCRVWGYGLCDIDTKTVSHGTTIEKFFKEIEKLSEQQNIDVYFHNLKFDGEFLLSYLLRHGYTYVEKKKDLKENTFTTLITDNKIFYTIEVCFSVKGRKKQKVQFFDSLKILPFSVEQIAKGFNLPFKKLEIDYIKHRERNHQLTPKEIQYIHHDVLIIAHALDILFKQGLTKMTAGSNALHDFKSEYTGKEFDRFFPVIGYDADIRGAYKGGFAYVNPKFKGKEVSEGQVFDVNSLYPFVMYNEILPYGEGKYFEGKGEASLLYPLFVQAMRCQFELKENHIPTIQLKNNPRFMETEYLHSSGLVEVTLVLTSVDLALFKEHYHLYNVEYLGGYSFKGTNQLFKSYIDRWSQVKIQAKLDGNEALYTLSKLMLNSLYGKFATNPKVQNSYPTLDPFGTIKYELHEPDTKDPVYVPVGAFVTAYARAFTIRGAQKNYDRFIYADTDSLHLIGHEPPKGLLIDPVELGAWSHDGYFKKAKYLRQKCYIQTDTKDNIKVTVAGMPNTIHRNVNYDNFETGTIFRTKYKGEIHATKNTVFIPVNEAKLRPRHVPGGIILEPTSFTIRK